MPLLSQRACYTAVAPEFMFGDLEPLERHSAELIAYCAEKKVEQFRQFAAVFHAGAVAMRTDERKYCGASRRDRSQHRSGAYSGPHLLIPRLPKLC